MDNQTSVAQIVTAKTEPSVVDRPIQKKEDLPKTPEDQNSAKPAVKPYKQMEFNEFLDMLRGEAVFNWVQIAKVLGVERDTIAEWRKLPAAQKAIRDGIEKALEGMTKAGNDDWRMWESKLKIIGVSPIEKSETDLLSGGEKIAGFNYLPPAVPEPPKSGDNDNSNDKTEL